MTTVNDTNKTQSVLASEPALEATPSPSDVLNALAARIKELEGKLEVAKASKRGKSEEELEMLEKHRKLGLKALVGLDIDKSLKGWIKVKTPGNPRRHPSISISKSGDEVYFMGLEWKQVDAGFERITKGSAQTRHIGYARGEASLTKDVTEVLKRAAEFLKGFKVEAADDDEE